MQVVVDLFSIIPYVHTDKSSKIQLKVFLSQLLDFQEYHDKHDDLCPSRYYWINKPSILSS